MALDKIRQYNKLHKRNKRRLKQEHSSWFEPSEYRQS
jgi:hypothetical protein